MIGRVGTALGEAGVNIVSAAVGRHPGENGGGEAVMVVTADARVSQEVIERVVAGDGFVAGRTVSL
jgi:D-3-phosphoglycerate dehydrogenase